MMRVTHVDTWYMVDRALGVKTPSKELRKRLGLEKGGVIIAEVSDDGIILKPAVAFPIEMYTDSRIKEFEKGDEKLMENLKKRSIE